MPGGVCRYVFVPEISKNGPFSRSRLAVWRLLHTPKDGGFLDPLKERTRPRIGGALLLRGQIAATLLSMPLSIWYSGGVSCQVYATSNLSTKGYTTYSNVYK